MASSSNLGRALTGLVWTGTALSVGGAAIALLNRATAPRLASDPVAAGDRVTVAIPARNEGRRLPNLLRDLQENVDPPELTIRILDDESTDDTAAVVRAAATTDPRITLHRGAGPRPGWTGKTTACQELADLSPDADLLVFIDADVRLEPDVLAAAVAELQRTGVGLLAVWPEQLAVGITERLLQPLLAWSWAASLPLAVANRGLRPSMAIACGQFLVVDAEVYRQIGGHQAVAGAVIDDLAFARAVRRSGFSTALAMGTGRVRCRMYEGRDELIDGYRKWLWAAYGGAAGSVAVATVLTIAYVVPPLAALFGRRSIRPVGAIGWLAAAGSRLAARSIESGRAIAPADVASAAAHPVAIGGYLWLSAGSHRRHRRGQLSWKGRPIR